MFISKENSSVLSNISFTFGARIITLFLTVLIGIIIARTLGPSGKGLLAVITMVGTVVLQLGHLGIGSFNIYAISNKSVEKKDIIANSFWSGLIIGIICFLILLIFVFCFPVIFRNIPRSYLLFYLLFVHHAD